MTDRALNDPVVDCCGRDAAHCDCLTLSDFSREMRVQAHPACDCWMTGDRYGTVVVVGRLFVHVKMDRSGKVRLFRPHRLMVVESAS